MRAEMRCNRQLRNGLGDRLCSHDSIVALKIILAMRRASWYDYTMKRGTSFALSDEALRLIKGMAASMGVSQTAVLEMAIREMAKSRKK